MAFVLNSPLSGKSILARLASCFRSFLFLLSGVLGTVCPQAVYAQPAMTFFRSEVPEGQATAQYRWAVDPAVADSDQALLSVVSDQRVSLYVNGQRVLKNAELSKSENVVTGAGFDVRPLLRPGRNLVAVEISSSHKAAVFGISLVTRKAESEKNIGGPWKTAPSLPPVGWQQTDFNDRDWPEAKSVTGEPGDRFTAKSPAEFVAPVLPAKKRTFPLQIEDGDRIVFVGATFFERCRLSEHLETTLTSSLGDRRVTFRNLGWDADTVFADSRGIFDRPEVGFLRMVEHIRAEEPTVAVICYGQNEALTPGMTPEKYTEQLERLLDQLEASGIACILVSPHELFPASPPVPSPSRFNPKIKVYADATFQVAQKRDLLYVDLFTDFTKRMLEIDQQLTGASQRASLQATYSALSENGIHLSDHGYRCASLVLRERLLGMASEETGIESERYETLRALIMKKNELYFHRWRPQNITYLFGFRKHEQGNNAADIAKFDPFIDELETQIYRMQLSPQ